jgi:hypothetical protein
MKVLFACDPSYAAAIGYILGVLTAIGFARLV